MNPLIAIPYAAAAALADLLAHTPIPGNSKALKAIKARRNVLDRFEQWGKQHRDPAKPLIWFHAPSVGEGLQARPVIDLLRKTHADIQLAYTFYSPSAEKFAATLDVDFTDYLPFDRRSNARRAISALNPTALIYSKLDLWPNLTHEAKDRNVKLGMISATLASGSARLGFFARTLLMDAYKKLDVAGAISQEDAERLIQMGVKPELISVTGDTRYDQVVLRTQNASDNPLVRALKSSRPTLVAGSTWPADERVLLSAWNALRRETPNARLIIAPHEPNSGHLAPIQSWAGNSGLRLSLLDSANPDNDVILVNKVGVLGDLYALADAAFVGGGFHNAGLHSVLEPAAFGTPVIFGPLYTNSRDAELLLEAKGGESVTDSDTLARALRILFTETDTRNRAGEAARELVLKGTGAAERSARLIQKVVGR